MTLQLRAMSLLCAAVFAINPQPVVAADCPATPYRFLRFDEDFRSLRDEACRRDPWDAVKFVPLDAAGERFLTLGGDLRLQLLHEHTRPFGQAGDNGVLLGRYHLHANVQAADGLRLFAEVKSNQQNGRKHGPLPADVDRFDIHQLFVDFGSEKAALLRVGRQELLYGSGRRIFPRNGANVRGNFDGLRVMTTVGGWRTEALAFQPVEIDKGLLDDGPIDSQTFWGVYATGTVSVPWQLDLYFIGDRRRGARFGQGASDEHRQTFGARASARSSSWDHDHEATLQRGRFGSGTIAAWAFASETGYSWADAARRPRASLRISIASGDRDPAQPKLQTFYSLFPRGGALDEGIGYSAANLTHLRAALEFDAAPAVRILTTVNTEWRTSERDGIYGAGGGLFRAAGSSRARHVGYSADVLATWTIDRHAYTSLAAGRFISGRFLAESGSGRGLSFLTLTYAYRF